MHQDIHIVSLARSGSNYLHEIVCKGLDRSWNLDPYYEFTIEPFNIDKLRTEIPNLRSLLTRRACFVGDTINVIVKNHYYELEYLNNYSQTLYQRAYQKSFYRVLLLRRNLWHSSMSLSISLAKGEWSQYTSSQVTIDPRLFRQSINYYIMHLKDIQQNRLGLDYNKIVYYEDLSFDHVQDLELIGLNCKNKITSMTTKKSYNKKMIVENYDELKYVFNEVIKDIGPNLPFDFYDGKMISIDIHDQHSYT